MNPLPETLSGWLNEGLLVGNDVFVLDGGEDPHFVDGVVFLLLLQAVQPHFLKGVDLAVDDTSDFVDRRVGSVT